MYRMEFFSSKFKRQKTPEGSYQYWFTTCYKQDDKTANEKPPISIDGESVCAANGFSYEEEQNIFKKLPEEVFNPMTSKLVFDQWLNDCSNAFVKPPTIEQCLANVQNIFDSNAPIAVLDSAEETSSWTLQWIPTRIKVDPPHFQIYWAPSFKTLVTRIPDFGEESISVSDLVAVELQEPEKSYNNSSTTRLIKAPTRLSDWTQELTEVNIPLSDSPALRLNIDSQREKFRQRIREARIRAKLARYRAERLAQRYEEKFGDYPEEDNDEAETEVDQSDEE
jgi:hypothetical protein